MKPDDVKCPKCGADGEVVLVEGVTRRFFRKQCSSCDFRGALGSSEADALRYWDEKVREINGK